jgi:hypothetical protein
MNFNDQNVHPDQIGRILYFAATYLALLIISYLYYNRSVESQLTFPIYPLPGFESQRVIYILVVIFMGLVGIQVVIGNFWTAYSWILYSCGNVLIGIYIFLYQLTSRFTLLITTVAAIALAVDLQWLFIQSSNMGESTQDLIIRNLLGAVGAWGLIFFLITMGQLFVHTVGINKKIQSVLFFIVSILLVAGIAYWNKNSYCIWS